MLQHDEDADDDISEMSSGLAASTVDSRTHEQDLAGFPEVEHSRQSASQEHSRHSMPQEHSRLGPAQSDKEVLATAPKLDTGPQDVQPHAIGAGIQIAAVGSQSVCACAHCLQHCAGLLNDCCCITAQVLHDCCIEALPLGMINACTSSWHPAAPTYHVRDLLNARLFSGCNIAAYDCCLCNHMPQRWACRMQLPGPSQDAPVFTDCNIAVQDYYISAATLLHMSVA